MSLTKQLKNILSLSFLKEVFTASIVRALFPDVLMYRGDAPNIDGDLPIGIYTTHPTTQGTFPANNQFQYGKIISLGMRNTNLYEIIIAENGQMASRTRYNGNWNVWRILS